MKTVELTNDKVVCIIEKEIPKVGRNDVLIKTKYAGICGSDIHAFLGLHPFRKPPVVLGHEISGTVSEIGLDVLNCEVGDRVTVLPSVSCGVCELCKQGKDNICLNKRVPGTKNWLGTFADYFVCPASNVFLLDDRISMKEGVLVEPLAVSVHANQIGEVKKGSKVLVLGAGTIGLFTGIAATYREVDELVFTDVFDSNLEIAAKFLCAKTFNVKDPNELNKMFENYTKYFDVVFVCNNAKDSINNAITMTKNGGSVVVIGMYITPPLVDVLEITLRELKLLGSQIYTARDYEETLDILLSKKMPIENVVTQIYKPEKAQEAFDQIIKREKPIIKVALDF